MVDLIPEIRRMLISDDTLMNIVSDVRYFRVPREPKSLVSPVVVFTIADYSDKLDYHGAAVTPIIEVSVFAYDIDEQVIAATTAANRISDILTTRRVSLPGGASTRISLNTGWMTLNEQDPNTVHLLARFTTSYWPRTRLTEILQDES